MRRILFITVALAISWIALYRGFQANSQKIQNVTLELRAAAFDSSELWQDEWLSLSLAARDKAWRYDRWIEDHHLEDGMVVGRHRDGRPDSECDSLLFSSLRYTALHKLGWHERAEEAWQGIQRAYQHGRWVRHPQCQQPSTSRDMIVGLLVALTQQPRGAPQRLSQVMEIVRDTGGSIDTGPFYVSRMSPGLGEVMRLMSQSYGMPLRKLPDDVRLGFSTLEVDSYLAIPGYTSHLNGLVLWTELELLRLGPENRLRSLSELFDLTLRPFASPRYASQRWQWVSQKLAAMDRQNLFFQWLELKTAGALNAKTKAQLLQRLLAMPQFPDEHLPRDCDRPADYLWQRHSLEYERDPQRSCDKTFSGVDWLWMAALLSEDQAP